jgi:4a-hydroxytetrahydrobiopterin dehydratase
MNWITVDKRLTKKFECKNFIHGIEFINKIALSAEHLDHHPNILLHDYNKVEISLYTHSQGSITEKDYILADIIDSLYDEHIEV